MNTIISGLYLRLFFVTVLLGLISGCSSILKINSVSPPQGLPGTVVTIQGEGFNPIYYENQVTIGGASVKVISGTTQELRVVALKNLTTGLVEVNNGTSTVTAIDTFKRFGTTLMATPLEDSDAELKVGSGAPSDKRFDMLAQGLNQKILVVLVNPSDINPEDLATGGVTARQNIIDKLAEANTYFRQSSYNLTSANFNLTSTWLPLSQIRDFYFWTQEDIDRAELQVDAAEAALEALNLSPSATAEEIAEAEEDLEEAKLKLNQTKDRNNLMQEGDFFFAESLQAAKSDVADFDTYTDYVVITSGPFLRGQNFGTETGYSAEWSAGGISAEVEFSEPKGITYVAQEANWGRIVHELGHFFAGGDLYSSSSADGSRVEGNAAPFAMMGNHNSHPLYIGPNMYNRLNYFKPQNISNVEWGSSATFNQTYVIEAHAETEDGTGNSDRHLLRVHITDGLDYFVEVRQRPDATHAEGDYVFDPNIPLNGSPAWQGGVLISKSVGNNNQSNNRERPISLVPPARLLQEGESFSDPARTLRISVVDRLTDRPLRYRVRVEWGTLPSADPDGQFDLRIRPWSPPPWESPDIWANSTKNDETSPSRIIYANHEPGDETVPIGNGDAPWVGHDNFIYAHIYNDGIAPTAESVKVSFYTNSPPGVGDDGTWAPFDEVDVGIIAAGDDVIVKTNRAWRPSVGEHTCIKIFIQPQTGEVTFDNNEAQENFFDFEASSGSPFKPMEFSVITRNPYEAPVVLDLKAKNVPEFWNVALEHGSVWLGPKQNKAVNVVIWNDLDHSALPTSINDGQHRKWVHKPIIDIEGMTDIWGHQVFPVGGVSAFVKAVLKSEISIDVNRRGENGLHVTGQVTPNLNDVPVAIHITNDLDPKDVEIEHTKTINGGQIRHRTKDNYPPGKTYTIKAYILEGSPLSTAESNEVTIQ